MAAIEVGRIRSAHMLSLELVDEHKNVFAKNPRIVVWIL